MTDQTQTSGRSEGNTTKTLLHILEVCCWDKPQNVLFWALNEHHASYCVDLFKFLAKKHHPELSLFHRQVCNRLTLVVNNTFVTFRSAATIKDMQELNHSSRLYSLFLIDHSVYKRFLQYVERETTFGTGVFKNPFEELI